MKKTLTQKLIAYYEQLCHDRNFNLIILRRKYYIEYRQRCIL